LHLKLLEHYKLNSKLCARALVKQLMIANDISESIFL